jgi:hypothetical protein
MYFLLPLVSLEQILIGMIFYQPKDAFIDQNKAFSQYVDVIVNKKR